jgi:stalled ribosome rescue protein Dom34
MHIRTPRDDVQSEVAPLLAELETADDHAIADRLIEAVRADGLGVSGLKHTRRALEYGQADVLLLAPETADDLEDRNELIRLATQTSATIEIVEDHDEFLAMGGIGALLRYRW